MSSLNITEHKEKLFEDEVIEKKSLYAPPSGIVFATANESWTSCRVILAYDYAKSKKDDIYIRPNTIICDRLVRFILKLESHLGIAEHSKFFKVKYSYFNNTKNNAFLIRLSNFWKSHALRRSFLTAVIKAVDIYEETKKYEEIDFCDTKFLFKYLKRADRHVLYWEQKRYFKNKFALKRFIKGRHDINCKDTDDGWSTIFKNMSKNKVRKTLK